jgi:hypothetical protein
MRGNSGACVPHLHRLQPGSPPSHPDRLRCVVSPCTRHRHSFPPLCVCRHYAPGRGIALRGHDAAARPHTNLTNTQPLRALTAGAQWSDPPSCFLCFITAGPITKLCAWGEEFLAAFTLFGVEVTELSTNKQHTLSLAPAVCPSSGRFPLACRWRSLLRTHPPAVPHGSRPGRSIWFAHMIKTRA